MAKRVGSAVRADEVRPGDLIMWERSDGAAFLDYVVDVYDINEYVILCRVRVESNGGRPCVCGGNGSADDPSGLCEFGVDMIDGRPEFKDTVYRLIERS